MRRCTTRAHKNRDPTHRVTMSTKTTLMCISGLRVPRLLRQRKWSLTARGLNPGVSTRARTPSIEWRARSTWDPRAASRKDRLLIVNTCTKSTASSAEHGNRGCRSAARWKTDGTDPFPRKWEFLAVRLPAGTWALVTCTSTRNRTRRSGDQSVLCPDPQVDPRTLRVQLPPSSRRAAVTRAPFLRKTSQSDM